jgi:hypothetical protein
MAGEKPEFLLISEAMACLEAGMHGNLNQTEAVKEAKKHYPRASIGSGPQKEDAAKIIDNALMKDELSVFVLPDSTEGEVRGASLHVPPDVLRKMIRTRGGLPDRVIQSMRVFAKNPIQPELRAALSVLKSKLYVPRKEFEAWYEEVRKNWSSPTPPTYSDRGLKEDVDQVGALIEISADQPLVVVDVGGLRDQALLEASRRDHEVPLEAMVPISPLRCGFTDFTWNVGTKRTDLPIIARSRHYIARALLMSAALALAAAGIAINGWFARSLGSSDVAGWLFLAIGVAADLVALVLPSTAAGLWYAGQRVTALVGWAVWLVTFVFAVTAGIGFASTNISDVTLVRASRVTPAVTSAQAALTDAMAARDRECKGGVGKICREREAAVAERRQILDSAMTSVGRAADPQTDAAIKLVAWGSGGMLRPAPEDFAMLRLILLALLPQIGGMLLLVRRRSQATLGGVLPSSTSERAS